MTVRKEGDFDIGLLGDNELKGQKVQTWDVSDKSTWKVKAKVDQTQLEIVDRLYKNTELKIDLEVMKRRLRIQKGQSRKKTLVEERIEMLEAAVYKDYDSTKPIGGASNVVEVTNKGIALENETEVNREKLRGKFIVHINKKLPLTSKIQKYANEPVAFHLHKTRNFFERLDNNKKPEISTSEAIENLRNRIAQQELDDRRITTNRPGEKLPTVIQGIRAIEELKLNSEQNFGSNASRLKSPVSSMGATQSVMGATQQSGSKRKDSKNNLQSMPSVHKDYLGSENSKFFIPEIPGIKKINPRDLLTARKGMGSSQRFSSMMDRRLQSQIDFMNTGRSGSPPMDQTFYHSKKSEKFVDSRKESNRMNLLYNSMQNFISTETKAHQQRKKADPMKLINDARSRSSFCKLTRSQDLYALKRELGHQHHQQHEFKGRGTTKQSDAPKSALGALLNQKIEKKEVTIGNATFMDDTQGSTENSFVRRKNFKQGCREDLKNLIMKCQESQKDEKLTLRLIADLFDEHVLKQKGFETVYEILHSLTEVEVRVLETLFFYKVSNGDEFNQEAMQVVKDYKLGKMDPGSMVTKMQMRKSFKSRPNKKIGRNIE